MRHGWNRAIPLLATALGLVAWSGSCGAGEGEPGASPQRRTGAMALTITSPAFSAGKPIPRRFTCDGDDLSPALSWSGVPEGVGSFALIMDDPDAPPGTWVHWVLYDLPAAARELPEGLVREERLEDGTAHGQCWGVDRFSRVGYYGPCPPPGKPHHYRFRLFALDARLGLAPRATAAELRKAMQGHVLAETELVGTYGR